MTRRLVICLFTLAVVTTAIAEDVARVRSELATESPVWVGQRATIHVDLLSATLFAGTPHFDLPEIPGAIIMKVSGSPVISSEEIDGDTWSVQRHSFSFYAHRAGEYDVPSFLVRFSVAPAFGQPPQEQRRMTQALSLTAELPPGAEDLPLLISTTQLEVNEAWSPSVPQDGRLDLVIGDAITREITVQAEDVPGMALPPIHFPELPGTAMYPNSPTVADQEERGTLTGQRSESTTYVCETSGTFLLPTIVIPWWNTNSEELNRVTLPSVTVHVAEASGSAAEEVEDQSTMAPAGPMDRRPFLALMAVFAMIVAGWRLRPVVNDWLHKRRARRDASEDACFRRLETACRQNDPVASLNALTQWLEVQSSGAATVTIEAFVRQHEDAELSEELDRLQEAAIGRIRPWSGGRLASLLDRVRRRQFRPQNGYDRDKLPPLNPARSRTAGI